MGRAKKIILSVVIIVAVLAVGITGGASYQAKKSNSVKAISAVKSLSSKVTASVAAYGEVAKIEGRNITLVNKGESLVIKIKDGATVNYLIKTTGQITSTKKVARFEDIKPGDKLTINVKVLADGSIEGQIVTITFSK